MGDTSLANKKILYVEDDEASRYFMEMVIGEMGCKLVLCADGQQALEKIQAEKFDLILMDIRMPKLDGYKTSQMIRKMDKETPIVAITAYMRGQVSGMMLECWDSGMNGILAKPCSPEEIKSEIERRLLR